MPLLSCENLYKTYQEGHVEAVKDVTVTFDKGIHIIIGKSGSGKSTLLHMLGSLETPTKGKVMYDGLDLYKEADLEDIRRHHYGFIFQAYNLIKEINVRENIMLPNRVAGLKDTRRLNDLVKRLDIQDKLKQMPESLSGGEQQRVAIARALINKPEIIFADEPTGNLDEENRNRVMELLTEVIRENDTTLIMVTHDEDHLKYADHVYIMTDGRLRQDK